MVRREGASEVVREEGASEVVREEGARARTCSPE